MNPNDNRVAGSEFEAIFVKRALSNGLLVIKNHLTCKFTYNGRLQVVPGELDFKLVSAAGTVGYFDCKAYESDHFTYSQIETTQIDRAVVYNNWRVPSGFVVWFRPENAVVFFTGHMIAQKGPGNRFKSNEGYRLGGFETFDLNTVLRPKKGRPVQFKLDLTTEAKAVSPYKRHTKSK